MSEVVERMKEFVDYVALLKGDEKGEAQVFCDRLFVAFGHKGYKQAGATLEERLKDTQGGTSFADLLWRPRVLMEMKRRGAKLHHYYQQAFDYWVLAVPNRPRYVVLCNFDEFWIYDFDKQIHEPVDTVALAELPKRYTALAFLLKEESKPVFGNDLEAVTRDAADKIARAFNAMVKRGVDRGVAQRFVLQLVLAMFAEDNDLLPQGLISSLLDDCGNGGSSYDLFGGLFHQMNSQKPAPAGRFKGVPYFNGGLFAVVEPIELASLERVLLLDASRRDWSKVNPAVFGTLFQSSMFKEQRHATGAHYTAEADIQRVVNPTIVQPWRAKIDAAKSPSELLKLRQALHQYRVLDPACGSGNFLYVAYRELARMETRLIEVLRTMLSEKDFSAKVKGVWLIDPHNFAGIDINPFGIELAKVTLMLAKKLALEETQATLGRDQIDLPFGEDALPLDNLDGSFICGDALFEAWPKADAIIGNPPYQSKNKMQDELGLAYMNRVRERYSAVPGMADYCVYWFRRAHDELEPGGRAGLVGTNTIRENYSRKGGLEYIVAQGGTITDAVSSQVWSGDAAVHVSIVNWVKGPQKGTKPLSRQVGNRRDSPWEVVQLNTINPALSFKIDVSGARSLAVNAKEGRCYQGQTHGHEAFLLTAAQARMEAKAHPSHRCVLFPYLTATDLLAQPDSRPTRYVIDFGDRGILDCQHFGALFERVKAGVLPAKKKAAAEEKRRNDEAKAANPKARLNHHHAGILERWWQLFWRRPDMLAAIAKIPRYVVCSRVTKRPIFDFVSREIHPNDAVMVFPYSDDYSFGVLQSSVHWDWFVASCSTLEERFRYTSNTVFDTFPWPQSPDVEHVKSVAAAAVEVRKVRRELMEQHGLSLRALYRTLEEPGKHPLKEAQAALDEAVRAAYAMSKKAETLAFLLKLNIELAEREAAGKHVDGPGLPSAVKHPERFVTDDCISMPAL